MSTLNLPESIEEDIKREAYLLSQQNLSYNELCWLLAEKFIQVKRRRAGRVAKKVIQEKAEELFKQSLKEDEICWQIASIKVKEKI